MIDRTSTETLLAENAVAFRSRRDVVVAEGSDAADYLHGQLSQNVKGLEIGQSAWSLLLSPQGKIDAWLRLTRTGDVRFVLDLDEGFGEAALARLNRFKLRVDAELTLSALDWVAVRGPKSAEYRSGAADASDSVVLADLEWDGIEGFDLLGSDVAVPSGLEEGDPTAFEALRIQLAIPRLGAEIGESTIPAEVGVVDVSADFTKGCYVGQELVARVDSRGNNTPRSMRRMTLNEGADIAGLVGVPITQDGVEVGTITSAAPVGEAAVVLASIKRAADLSQPFSVATANDVVAALLIP